jgi:hypothetical protein
MTFTSSLAHSVSSSQVSPRPQRACENVLVEKGPRFLIGVEMEKGSKADREALITLCGQESVKVTKENRDETSELDWSYSPCLTTKGDYPPNRWSIVS